MTDDLLSWEQRNAKPSDNRKAALADARRTFESSAEFTRGGAPAVPDHDATERQRAERIEAEQRRLIEWAKANGKLGGKLPKDDVGGGEHIVRLSEKDGRVIKATQLGKHKGYGIALGAFSLGATPAEYLDRLNLQNLIFNDDIRLESVVLQQGKPVIITTQPAIKGTKPTQAAIDEMMELWGYEKFVAGGYYEPNRGLLIYDLFPKNAMQAEDGVIYPFDPVIQRINREFAEFLRQNPERIHNR